MSTSATSPVVNRPPIETDMEIRRHELFGDMAEQCTKRLMESHGIPLEAAVDIGNAIADFLADHWAGQYVYITADTRFRHSHRDLKIFQQMGRGKAAQLGREHGISVVRVYQIYKFMRAQMIRRVQPGLFEQDALPPLVSAEDALAEEAP